MTISDVRSLLLNFPDVILNAVTIEIDTDDVGNVNWITSMLLMAKSNNQMTDLDFAVTPGKLVVRLTKDSFIPPPPYENGQDDVGPTELGQGDGEETVQLE